MEIESKKSWHAKWYKKGSSSVFYLTFESIGPMLPWIQQFFSYKKLAKYLIGISMVAFLFFPGASSAQIVENQIDNVDTFGAEPVGESLILGGDDIRVTIVKIIRAALSLTGIVLLGIILYAGFLWMTSQGAEDKIAQAKGILTSAVIGLAIILSAFAIVQFVLRALNQATRGVPGGLQEGQNPDFVNFAGSGSLGRIIQDHYPFVDEIGVKRNTRIAVTFAEPIDPGTLIVNTNQSCEAANGQPTNDPAVCDPNGDGQLDLPAYLGDCIPPVNANDFDFSVHCDQLNTDSVQIVSANTPDKALSAAAFTTYEDGAEKNAYTFIFRPIELLGSENEVTTTTVTLTDNVKKKNGGEVFENERVAGNLRVGAGGDKYYRWNFFVDTTLDFDPPFVVGISPDENQRIFRNNIIQVTFSEPVDPSVAQGLSGPNSPFLNILFHDPAIQGEWKLTNGYRTAEFVSDVPCGQNSCGDTMYCLPTTNCAPNDVNCSAAYEVLLATAEKLPGNTFESRPFTGITDMAGNALDGRSGAVLNHDGVAQPKPNLGALRVIDNNERVPDNFWWSFQVQNNLDDSVPYIESVTPSLEAEEVSPEVPLTVLFNQAMWYKTLNDISLEEFPGIFQDDQEIPEGFASLRPPWKRIQAEEQEGKTLMIMDHRMFGPNNLELYYYPSVPSTVKGNNQNCLYPGRGPLYGLDQAVAQPAKCSVVRNPDGSVQPNASCTPPVPINSDTDTGCAVVRGAVKADQSQSTITACLDRMRALSPRF